MLLSLTTARVCTLLTVTFAPCVCVWCSFTGWEKLKAEHEEVKDEIQKRRLEGEQTTKAMQEEMAAANAAIVAEGSMVRQERQACQSERRELAVALLQHRSEVSKHREWLFAAMQTAAAEREQSVFQMASEGAKLEAQRHAATLSERNAAYERSVVAKERDAIADQFKSLEKQKEEAQAQRASLAEASTKLVTAREQVSAMAEETATQRHQVTELARSTAREAEVIAERQRQLQAQASELLRGATSERASFTSSTPRPQTAPQGGALPTAESIARANYTASGLGAFTLPLMASRAAGLTPESIASIEAATLATTTSATSALAAAPSE